VSALEPMGMLARGCPSGRDALALLAAKNDSVPIPRCGSAGYEVVPDDQLRSRAAELAEEIAARRPQAIQGTVRALWEARDLPPSVAQRHGLSYTHIGNAGADTDSRANKRAPRTR